MIASPSRPRSGLRHGLDLVLSLVSSAFSYMKAKALELEPALAIEFSLLPSLSRGGPRARSAGIARAVRRGSAQSVGVPAMPPLLPLSPPPLPSLSSPPSLPLSLSPACSQRTFCHVRRPPSRSPCLYISITIPSPAPSPLPLPWSGAVAWWEPYKL